MAVAGADGAFDWWAFQAAGRAAFECQDVAACLGAVPVACQDGQVEDLVAKLS